MLPDFSSECNAYTVTTQEDTLRLYAVFSNNSSLHVDGFNIVENTGVMNQEIGLSIGSARLEQYKNGHPPLPERIRRCGRPFNSLDDLSPPLI